MGKRVLLQQYVKRIIAVSDATWVAKRRCCQGGNIIAYLSFRTDVRNLKNGEQRFLVASLRRNDRESRSLAQLQVVSWDAEKFRVSKTTYRHPTLQSRADMMLLYCKHFHFMYKFYAPNNYINYPNFHS